VANGAAFVTVSTPAIAEVICVSVAALMLPAVPVVTA
jgi:hypothetical protein